MILIMRRWSLVWSVPLGALVFLHGRLFVEFNNHQHQQIHRRQQQQQQALESQAFGNPRSTQTSIQCQQQQQQHINNNTPVFVALSTTVNLSVRNMDYDFLAPLTALNWAAHGFTPLLLIVLPERNHDPNNHKKETAILELYERMLAKNAAATNNNNDTMMTMMMMIPIRIPNASALSPISVAQTVRLYAAHFVALHVKQIQQATAAAATNDAAVVACSPNSHDIDMDPTHHYWLRITDVDMMIAQPQPFQRPKYSKPSSDIDIFNGLCCRIDDTDTPPPPPTTTNASSFSSTTTSCQQYPMHSVGMSIAEWMRLFPIQDNDDDDETTPKSDSSEEEQLLIQRVLHQIETVTRPFSTTAAVPSRTNNRTRGTTILRHGGGIAWHMDQILLGCAVDSAVATRNLTLTTTPSRFRLHVNDPPQRISPRVTDVHLARFREPKHGIWLEQLWESNPHLMPTPTTAADVDGTTIPTNWTKVLQEYRANWNAIR